MMSAPGCIGRGGMLLSLLVAGVLLPGVASAAKVKTEARTAVPYLGAIVVEAESGQILFADKPDAQAYPASILKLMDLLIILDKLSEGTLKLTDPVTVTAEASKIGGSQVFLKEHEVFTVDDLLYALMVQSANDAATALAIHVAGSKEAFVDLMNQRARSLGMKNTVFHSIHGLPPGPGQQPDVTTARDLAKLGRELLKYPDTLRYTSTRKRGFRNDTFILETHNHLLGTFAGCDGFKTGFFTEAGYAIAATAQRGDTRVIAVVLGSPSRSMRDAKTAELLTKGFMLAPKKPKPAPAIVTHAPAEETPAACRTPWCPFSLIAIAVVVIALIASVMAYRKSRRPPPPAA